MFKSCTRDLGVLIFVVSKQVHVKKKNKVAKLHVGLVTFYSSYDWQLVWLQVRKPFDWGVKLLLADPLFDINKS